MSLSKEEKKAAIDAKRATLEHEKYAAQLDVKTAKAGKVEELLEEPEARLKRVEDQLAALDKEEKKLK